MPAKTKITPEIANRIRELVESDYNTTRIAKDVELSRGTIVSFCSKNDIVPIQRQSPEEFKKEQKFIAICQLALSEDKKIKLNDVLKEVKIHPETAQKILKNNPAFRQVVRSKSDAIAEDKTLPISEVQLRLPDQLDKVISFEDGKYKIRAFDGFIYYKTSAKIKQGDPRGKSGFIYTEDEIRLLLKKQKYTLIEGSYLKKRLAWKATHDECGSVRINRFKNFFKKRGTFFRTAKDNKFLVFKVINESSLS